MNDCFRVHPIGVIKKRGEESRIEIKPEYLDALLGLEGFSHINVFYWLHENDDPEKRGVLRVHPRGDKNNPLSGVFATHSPMRPNLIAFSLCRIVGIDGGVITLDKIDAFDGSPVIDIKCYIPPSVWKSDVRLPGWV